ncbi:MAG: LPXTG cell wall anchor domain-containing protein [Oscillospiraceae bacterium]|nr:LPXTG cell wall anchor domain-containing protein [Oscillospiraceae bacterium]MBP3674169.1 LPXTG cell wall anchor domain-containing protein [Oscillospiraceae bacterium]
MYRRLLSVFLVLLLVMSLPFSAFAASTDGTAATTETAETVTTEPVIQEETEPAENPAATEPTEAVTEETTEVTDPTDNTEPTEPTDPPENTEEVTEETEVTEPVEEVDPPEETEALEDTEPPEENEAKEESEGILITPDPIVEENPYDPDWPYPYGLPVDNDFPDDLLDADPYGIMLLADMSLIPDEMYDNYILRALAYTGYDVDYLKDNGYLYVAQYTSSNINTYAPQVLSNIGYDDYSPFCNGDETVADSSTVSGKAPNIALFEQQGLVCASFVSYYWNNYLPNIEGIDTTWVADAIKATTMNNGSYSTASVWAWETGLKNLASQSGSGVTRYTDATTAYANLVPGDIIVFSNSSGSLTHVAVYAGAYTMYNASGTNRGTYHYIIHVGNSRGPEISAVEYMTSSGSKSSSPSAFYHIELPEAEDPDGYIEVYKDDTDGYALDGAYFVAQDQATGQKYTIGPTVNGYACSGPLPLSTFYVYESVFPDGYGPSGTTEWYVTLTKDNAIRTIYAENTQRTGSLTVRKATTNGQGVELGWKVNLWKVLDDGSYDYIGSGTTKKDKNDPTYTFTGLAPGRYLVQEDSGNSHPGYSLDMSYHYVDVVADQTATVTITNIPKAYLVIQKDTNTGADKNGWKYNIYTNAAMTELLPGSPFTTDENGEIKVEVSAGTFFVEEVDESATHLDWVFDQSTHVVTIKAGETVTVVSENTQLGQFRIIKDMPDGGSVAGWEFDAYRLGDSENTFIGTFTTGEDGTILSGYIEEGDYLIYEKIPEDSLYVNETENPQTVTVVPGETAAVTFTNRLRPGRIDALKLDLMGEPRAGAEFLLEWSEDGTAWYPVSYSETMAKGGCSSADLTDGRLTSGENGVASFDGLHPALYYRLTETKAPDGLALQADHAFEGKLPQDAAFTITVTVINGPEFELPKTGASSGMILRIAGLAAAISCLGAVIVYRRKKV